MSLLTKIWNRKLTESKAIITHFPCRQKYCVRSPLTHENSSKNISNNFMCIHMCDISTRKNPSFVFLFITYDTSHLR